MRVLKRTTSAQYVSNGKDYVICVCMCVCDVTIQGSYALCKRANERIAIDITQV